MLGDALVGLFSSLGFFGGLIAIFLIFYFDAMIIPLIPELFAVLIFQVDPTLQWAVLILVVAEVGEILGNSTLYFVAKTIGVPRFMKKAMNRYVNFLVLKDERLILSNRIAPTVPFVGAFIAACEWDFRKSISYVALGGLIKYTILLSIVAAFNVAYPRDLAQNLTLIMVLLVIALSGVLAFIRFRKERARLLNATEDEKTKQVG
jgi:membrane protein YqaA with SNARE-associated domain